MALGAVRRNLTQGERGATIVVMLHQNQTLLNLQITDTEIETLRRRVRTLQAALTDQSHLTKARTARDAALQASVQAREALRAAETKLSTLTAAITKLEKRLYDGSIHNEREAHSVEDELRHRRAEKLVTEDSVLTTMEEVDTTRQAATAAATSFDEMERDQPGRISALKAEGRDTMAKIQARQEHRVALSAALPPAALTLYDKLKAGLQPVVVSITPEGSCGGCGVSIPSGMRQHAAGGAIERCINCTRILA